MKTFPFQKEIQYNEEICCNIKNDIIMSFLVDITVYSTIQGFLKMGVEVLMETQIVCLHPQYFPHVVKQRKNKLYTYIVLSLGISSTKIKCEELVHKNSMHTF